jgi:hypothetical protein
MPPSLAFTWFTPSLALRAASLLVSAACAKSRLALLVRILAFEATFLIRMGRCPLQNDCSGFALRENATALRPA